MKNQNAFTMIELLIIVGIVGILLVVSVSLLNGNTQDAKNQALANKIEILEQQVKAFKNTHGTYPLSVQVDNSNSH